jgi:tetratricopeptide (TPR) repeat protein
MNADKEIGTDPEITYVITREGHWLIDQGCNEEAAIAFLRCVPLERDPLKRVASLKELGYCYQSLGWFEDVIKVYKQLLAVYPDDADIRFYLASAYASLKWTNEAIAELKTILRSDPTDVLARHDLSLSYREKGWLRESLEEMRKANKYAAVFGNAEEKEIIKSSLGHIEEEIQGGDEDGTKEAFLFLILLATVLKRSRLKARKPLGEH